MVLIAKRRGQDQGGRCSDRGFSYDKAFSLLTGYCLILPMTNATAEMRAWYIMECLLSKLEACSALTHVEAHPHN
jgi:hypothetical protein